MMLASVPRGTLLPAVAVAATITGLLAWGESVHASAARRATHLPGSTPGGDATVVVLGFRNRGSTANTVNRWRAGIAVRTARRLRQAGVRVTIVASGGAVGGRVPEAVVLRDTIVGTLGWGEPVLVEDASRSTWENIRNVLPMIEKAGAIAIASNGLHAEKARDYLARQRPDLVDRLVAADDYRLGEHIVLKPIFAIVGLRKLRRLRQAR
jgi:uncharacterized SAM-binding protein YcdF (DUF218 family)